MTATTFDVRRKIDHHVAFGYGLHISVMTGEERRKHPDQALATHRQRADRALAAARG